MHKLEDLKLDAEAKAQFEKDLVEWFELNQAIAEFKPKVERERQLRKEIFGTAFPEPVEGANNKCELPDGYILQATQNYDRKVDYPSFTANKTMFQNNGIDSEKLVDLEPKLKVSAYKGLSKEKKLIFAQCVIEKPSSVKLEIKAGKKFVKKDD